ncbi:MAG TPA: protein-export chaperone SecB [Chromatiales bacterium]|nr:protein-export chaperone SecB [Chromatiales bacterium]
MSETNAANTQPEQPPVLIRKVYLKDSSFEAPNTPQIFSENWKPEVNIQLSNSGTSLGNNAYEVVLSITITTKLGDKTAYLIEVHQAGIFETSGIPEEDIPRFLGTFCPANLFPYLRQTVDDLLHKGGFPGFLLTPVDFDAIYEGQAQQKQQQAAAGEAKH